MKAQCEVCGERGGIAHNHVLQGQCPLPKNLCFVVRTGHLFESPLRVAAELMAAKEELRTYFPGRTFEIIPGMLRLIHNEYVPVNYLVLEKVE